MRRYLDSPLTVNCFDECNEVSIDVQILRHRRLASLRSRRMCRFKEVGFVESFGPFKRCIISADVLQEISPGTQDSGNLTVKV